ncbi:MAG: hypothetical protein MUO88_14740 [Desulfobacterales bacterium]|jgi:hypothetical protein|nr:hypothetical protein [Desulfobacterales bacterium]
MENSHQEEIIEPKKGLFHAKGVTYFDRKTERKIFFVLTLIMLLLGIFSKLGLF